MPMLQLDDGTQLVQTRAILQWIADTYGKNLKPSDATANYNGLVAENLFWEDFFMAKRVPPAIWAKEGREELMATLFNEHVPEFLKKLETLFTDDKKFLCGDHVTIYDIQVCGFFTNLVLNPNSKDPQDWAKVWENTSPRLKKWVADFQEDMKEYLDKRPKEGITM